MPSNKIGRTVYLDLDTILVIKTGKFQILKPETDLFLDMGNDELSNS